MQSNKLTWRSLFQSALIRQEACMGVGMILPLSRGIRPCLLIVPGSKLQERELMTT